MDKIYLTEGSTEAIIITGYLGSGKTSLLKKILQIAEKSHSKIAVLENEFGSVGMDGSILKKDGIELREVAGGCVCCTQQGMLVQELSVLSEMGINKVFIEASGVADPNSIASEFFEAALFGKVKRGPGITVIDAHNANSYIEQDIAKSQIAFADIIYISKAEPDNTLIQKIKALNSHAPIFQNSEISELIEFLEKPHHINHQTHSHTPTSHSESFDSMLFTSTIAFDKEDFRYTINQILKAEHCYRIKGIVKCKGKAESFYFESVRFYGEEKPLSYIGLPEDGYPEQSELIFIGKNLNKSFLNDSLLEAVNSV